MSPRPITCAALLALTLGAACKTDAPPAPPAKPAAAEPAPDPSAAPTLATPAAPAPLTPLACAPDGTTRWHGHGVTELEPRGVGALKGSEPPADHYAYVCEGGRIARVERRDGSGSLEGEDGGPALERVTEATPTRIVVERLDAADRPLGRVTLDADPADGTWTRSEQTPSAPVTWTEKLRLKDALVVERRAFDAQGQPATPWGGDAHAAVLLRSPTGAVLEQSWIGADGAPVPDARAIWRVRTTYNGADMPTEEAFLDADGAPMTDGTGLSVLLTERDFAGNELRSTRLGPTRAPAPTTEGVVTIHTVRDPRGHAVLEETLDGGGKPVATFRGIARAVMMVDPQGRLLHKAWQGLGGGPVTDGTGLAAYGWDYADDPVAGRKRFFLADGAEVDRHGKPLPPAPH